MCRKEFKFSTWKNSFQVFPLYFFFFHFIPHPSLQTSPNFLPHVHLACYEHTLNNLSFNFFWHHSGLVSIKKSIKILKQTEICEKSEWVQQSTLFASFFFKEMPKYCWVCYVSKSMSWEKKMRKKSCFHVYYFQDAQIEIYFLVNRKVVQWFFFLDKYGDWIEKRVNAILRVFIQRNIT